MIRRIFGQMLGEVRGDCTVVHDLYASGSVCFMISMFYDLYVS